MRKTIMEDCIARTKRNPEWKRLQRGRLHKQLRHPPRTSPQMRVQGGDAAAFPPTRRGWLRALVPNLAAVFGHPPG